MQDTTSAVYAKHKSFVSTIETMLADYRTGLTRGQNFVVVHGETVNQNVQASKERTQLNMEYIGSFIQEHFEEVN